MWLTSIVFGNADSDSTVIVLLHRHFSTWLGTFCNSVSIITNCAYAIMSTPDKTACSFVHLFTFSSRLITSKLSLYCLKGNVHPCTALRLCRGRTAHRGSRGIALPFHDHGTRRGWWISVTLLPLLTPRPPAPERHCTHCTGGWVGPRAGLDRCRKSLPHRDSIPGLSSP
jgi:hypothetical protein